MSKPLPDPNSCFYCNQPARGHYGRWAMGVGFHKYVAPNDIMRKDRMIQRRAAHIAGGSALTAEHLAGLAHRIHAETCHSCRRGEQCMRGQVYELAASRSNDDIPGYRN